MMFTGIESFSMTEKLEALGTVKEDFEVGVDIALEVVSPLLTGVESVCLQLWFICYPAKKEITHSRFVYGWMLPNPHKDNRWNANDSHKMLSIEDKKYQVVSISIYLNTNDATAVMAGLIVGHTLESLSQPMSLHFSSKAKNYNKF